MVTGVLPNGGETPAAVQGCARVGRGSISALVPAKTAQACAVRDVSVTVGLRDAGRAGIVPGVVSSEDTAAGRVSGRRGARSGARGERALGALLVASGVGVAIACGGDEFTAGADGSSATSGDASGNGGSAGTGNGEAGAVGASGSNAQGGASTGSSSAGSGETTGSGSSSAAGNGGASSSPAAGSGGATGSGGGGASTGSGGTAAGDYADAQLIASCDASRGEVYDGAWFAVAGPYSSISPADSSGSFPMTSGGYIGTGAHVTGSVTSGDYAQIGHVMYRSSVLFDASAYDGISFYARAAAPLAVKVGLAQENNDPSYGLCVEDVTCYNYPASVVNVGTEWQRFVVPFSALASDPGQVEVAPTPGTIKHFQFSMPPGSFDFWIDELYFVRYEQAL